MSKRKYKYVFLPDDDLDRECDECGSVDGLRRVWIPLGGGLTGCTLCPSCADGHQHHEFRFHVPEGTVVEVTR